MADTTDNAIAPETHSYKELRRRYDISVARATLEFAESGDNDKLWPAINERQDARDEAIFKTLFETDPPSTNDEIWELLQLIKLFLKTKNQLGITSDVIETVIELVNSAASGITDMKTAGERAKREAKDNPEPLYDGLSQLEDPIRTLASMARSGSRALLELSTDQSSMSPEKLEAHLRDANDVAALVCQVSERAKELEKAFDKAWDCQS